MTPPTPPEARRITPEDQPVFPCWLYRADYADWQRFSLTPYSQQGGWTGFYTHWHPDQPTAPTQPPAKGRGPLGFVLAPPGDPAHVPAPVEPPAPLAGGTAQNPSTATRDIAGWAKVLADEIYAAMKGRGLTQSDLADKMGVSRQYISRVLAAGENFSLETLAKFANALDLKLRVKLSRIESQNCPECGGVLPWCALRDRIRNYFGNGGLFNPEHMEHQKVRDLLMDVADAIDAGTPPAPAEVAAGCKEGRPVSPATGEREAELREAIEAVLFSNENYGGHGPFNQGVFNQHRATERLLRALTPLLDRREGEHEKREEDLMRAWSADLTEHERNEAALRTLVAKQREALQMLLDNQNGCPLHTWQKEWDEAIRLTGIALVLTPEGIADELAAKDAEIARLNEVLHAIAEETDLRNIRGTIQNELKQKP